MKGLLLSLALMASAPARDAVVTVHLVEMEQEKLTEALGGGQDGLFERVRGMVKADEAKIYDTLLLRGKVGTKMTMESGRKVIYPTAYLISAEFGCNPSLPPVYMESVTSPRLPPTPASFETRSVGESFMCVVESTGDGQWELNHSAEWVLYPNDVEFHALINHLADWDRRRVPMFETRDLNQKVVLKSGAWVLGGIISSRLDDGSLDTERMMLAMLRCEILNDKD